MVFKVLRKPWGEKHGMGMVSFFLEKDFIAKLDELTRDPVSRADMLRLLVQYGLDHPELIRTLSDKRAREILLQVHNLAPVKVDYGVDMPNVIIDKDELEVSH